mgnify:CR=1 FL=1
MKYILFNTSTEKYLFSNVLPEDQSNFDIIDVENKKVISGPSGEGDLVRYTEEEDDSDDEEAEVPIQEIEPLLTDEAA